MTIKQEKSSKKIKKILEQKVKKWEEWKRIHDNIPQRA
jgi:hypothetical protein